MKKMIFLVIVGFIFLAISLAVAADIPMMLNYQGYVEYGEEGNRVPFDGNGFFKFAIVDPNGNTTYWSNDGTSTTGNEPDNEVKIPVTNGVFTVKLGNTDMTNMSALPTTVFEHQNIYVRVWFSGNNNMFEQLAPDTQIVSAGFAYKAQTAQIAENLSGVTLGIPGGVATLDQDGKIPNDQLPGIAVDPAGNVGVGTAEPVEKFQIGDRITMHNGSDDSFNFNAYYDYGWKYLTTDSTFQMYWDTSNDQLRFQTAESSAAGDDISWNNAITINASGEVGIGTTSPEAKLHVTTDAGDSQAFIRASNFNPVPTAYWPDFDITTPYLLRKALWIGWDDSKKAWKYIEGSDDDRGLEDPGDPATWVVNGKDTGYFDGDLDTLPPGTHINNKYNPKMMAYRCDQDDIQVKVGSFWIDKYACRIIDVGPDYKGRNCKDDAAEMNTNANTDVSPFWMAFSQKDRASTGMTWFVAAQAAVNAGKQLPTNAEWQASALGTARSTGNRISGGNNWSKVEGTDVSRYGIVGMAGNIWEWVADGDKAPSVSIRGGDWDNPDADVFDFAYHDPMHWDNSHIGFRSVR